MRRIGSFTATTGIANIFSLTTRSLAASTFVWAIVWLQCIEDASSSMATTTTPVIPTTPWVQGVGRKDLQLHHRLQQNRQTKEKSPRITTQQQQTEVRAYELWQPEEIVESILRWAGHYPDLLRVTTSQSAYDLPSAGGKNDCPFEPDNEDGCRNYILTLQDFAAHPEGSESSARLPELLWSGELHGNERVGPTAVLEATLLLLEAASCEELPRLEVKQQKADLWKNELERANSCREKLARQGIDDEHRQWLARLVTTRRIVIVPTANALGYFQNTREENGIDPNRDFPYDVLNPKDCMQTIAGRTLNEVFREHLFQLSLTFHGGMEMIGYEWGATSWQDPNTEKTPVSPDNTAQTAIAMAYSDFAGGWSNTENYGFGP